MSKIHQFLKKDHTSDNFCMKSWNNFKRPDWRDNDGEADETGVSSCNINGQTWWYLGASGRINGVLNVDLICLLTEEAEDGFTNRLLPETASNFQINFRVYWLLNMDVRKNFNAILRHCQIHLDRAANDHARKYLQKWYVVEPFRPNVIYIRI